MSCTIYWQCLKSFIINLLHSSINIKCLQTGWIAAQNNQNGTDSSQLKPHKRSIHTLSSWFAVLRCKCLLSVLNISSYIYHIPKNKRKIVQKVIYIKRLGKWLYNLSTAVFYLPIPVLALELQIYSYPCQMDGVQPLMGHNCNHNRLQLCHQIQETKPNHMGLVHISPVVVHQPVLTGPITDWLGPVATGPSISLNWSSIQNVLCYV